MRNMDGQGDSYIPLCLGGFNNCFHCIPVIILSYISFALSPQFYTT